MREKESKYEIESLMKIATCVMFTKISAKIGIKKFVKKEVSAIGK